MENAMEFSVEFSDLKKLNLELLKNKANAAIAANQSKRLADSLKAMGPAFSKVNSDMRRNSTLMSQSTKVSRGHGLAIQQAGYQIQDFIVQVQAGTNPLIAFSQQGSQLAGFFMGPWGAAIGVGIAAVSSFAMVIQNTGTKIKTLEDRLSDLKSIMSSVKDTTDILRMSASDLADTYGNAAAAVKQFATLQAYALQAQAAARFADSAFVAKTALEDFITTTKTFDDTGNTFNDITDAVRSTADAFGVSKETAVGLVYALQDLNNAKSTDQLQTALEKVSGIILDAKGDLSGIPEHIRDAIAQMAEFGIVSAQTAEAIKQMSGTLSQMTVGISPDTFKSLYGDNLLPEKTVPDDPKRTGAKKKTTAEIIKDLKTQDALQRSLIGTTDAYKKVVQAVGLAYSDSHPKIVQGLVAQLQATQDLIDKQKEQEALANFIESSMENTFMSMIDGTMSVKDAFKKMASDIIKELYRVMVVQKAVKAITGYFGFADGGVFNGGSQVNAYADGGVVGGPTYFPMSGGKTGLMGEAGPEAIMPLKRGANGKLGVQVDGNSGGNITVVQHNSFGAGVSRAEIQAMMPKIVETTKAAVLDAKKRGGSYGSAFA